MSLKINLREKEPLLHAVSLVNSLIIVFYMRNLYALPTVSSSSGI